MIHSFSDKSILVKIKAKELIGIPVWKGNRFIDLEHAQRISSAIENVNNLDSTVFRVVKYIDGTVEQKYLVDGQHRQHVIKQEFNGALFLSNFSI